MEPHISPSTKYQGRALDVIPVNLSLSRRAVDLLQKHAPSRRGYGRFLSELVVQFDQQEGLDDLLRSTRRDLQRMLREVRQEFSSGSGKK
jgi:hypothetical protein